jgi:hypothetical protein
LFRDIASQPLTPSDSWQQLRQRTWSLPLLEGEQTNLELFNPKPRRNDPEPYQDKTFQLQKNPLGWSQLHFVADSLIEITDTAQRKGLVEMGYGKWKTTKVSFYPLDARYATVGRFNPIKPPFRIGACYAWKDDELQAKLHYVDWMSSVLLRIKFQGDKLEIVAKENYLNNTIRIDGSML